MNIDSQSDLMTKRLFYLAGMTVALGLLRLASLDIMFLISDLLTALMVYFYATSKSKCMALFCMINGVIGIIYAIVKFFPAFNQCKEEWFTFYPTFLLLVSIYACFVYSLICVVAGLGLKDGEGSLGLPGIGGASSSQNASPSSNYGAVSQPASSGNYTAFSGKGHTIV